MLLASIRPLHPDGSRAKDQIPKHKTGVLLRATAEAFSARYKGGFLRSHPLKTPANSRGLMQCELSRDNKWAIFTATPHHY